jgi:hypothetical protein
MAGIAELSVTAKAIVNRFAPQSKIMGTLVASETIAMRFHSTQEVTHHGQIVRSNLASHSCQA